jgi:hypothetical protein
MSLLTARIAPSLTIMRLYIRSLPVSIHFNPDLPRSLVLPSAAVALGHSSIAGVFSEVITTAYQGRGLTTDITFGVSLSLEVDVHLGLNWLSAWCQVGHDRLSPAPNPYNVELGRDPSEQFFSPCCTCSRLTVLRFTISQHRDL